VPERGGANDRYRIERSIYFAVRRLGLPSAAALDQSADGSGDLFGIDPGPGPLISLGAGGEIAERHARQIRNAFTFTAGGRIKGKHGGAENPAITSCRSGAGPGSAVAVAEAAAMAGAIIRAVAPARNFLYMTNLAVVGAGFLPPRRFRLVDGWFGPPGAGPGDRADSVLTRSDQLPRSSRSSARAARRTLLSPEEVHSRYERIPISENPGEGDVMSAPSPREETLRNLHLERAVLATLDYATTAEDPSFQTAEFRAVITTLTG
jgi:hypothetical protein